MSFLNPFNGLIETKKYPHARTLRTTFWGKVWDTFKVFSGNLIPDTKSATPYKKVHAGIFDYLTLGLHFLLSELILLALRKIKSPAVIITGLIILLIINIPRLIFGAVLTLFCLPFAGIAQVLSKIKGDKLKNEILEYTVKTDECKLYLVNSISQINLEYYKNSFFFVKSSNSLYMDVSGDIQKIELKDPDKFRNEIIDGNDLSFTKIIDSNYLTYINRDILNQYILDSNPLNTYHSIREILKINDINLQAIKTVGIEAPNAERINLWFNTNKSTVIKFFVEKNNLADREFVFNLTRLNIGGIQENSEEAAQRRAQRV